MPLVVGVDSSTTACKVEVRDADSGDVVATGRAPHPPTTPPRSEQDPGAWADAFQSATEQAGVGSEHRISAIAVAAQQHGMVVLDGRGEVLRPAKLWNDVESAPDASALVEAHPAGAAGWAEACGSVPVPSFTVTKLAWLRRCEPVVFRQATQVLLPHDWLTARLTHRTTTDRGDASGTGYWSPGDDTYRFDLLDLVDADAEWTRMLPEVLGPDDVAGKWDEQRALVAAGTGDNMAAALGLGLREGDLALSIGTSGTAFTVSPHPTADASGTIAGFADATGRYLPLVCTLNATKVTDAFARLLGLDAARFDEAACRPDRGPGTVVVVPHFDGERTPGRPDATGTIRGLRSDVTAEQLARAAVHGVVCNLLDGADALANAGASTAAGDLVLIGGGAASPAYQRAVADLSGRPVKVRPGAEVVARGAAVQAAAVLHGRPPALVAEAWAEEPSLVVEPDGGFDRVAARRAYTAAVHAEGCAAEALAPA